ncbi:MAG: ATP-dependent Clp protease adaptor ClpS [Candidatus Promineifilaceae bacterium]|jgi:ATP-dependent Clp protease adaptor protein ClpS
MIEILQPVSEAETERVLEKIMEDALEPNCRVIIHNDDVTPYEFVIMILLRVFQLEFIEAERITYVAHTSGIAHVITLPCPEANKRVGKAHFAASLEGYPLMFTIEPED